MIPPLAAAAGPLGAAEWSVGPITPSAEQQLGTAAGTASSGGFGGMLSNAIDSLEQSQATATGTAQALATGQLSDPTQAVSAIENASLSMQLAAQVRNKLDETATQILQTQV